MTWTGAALRRAACVAAALAACAKVDPESDPAGADVAPQVASVEPRPGAAEAGARFHVAFSVAMDEGQLLAAPDRSETVVLVAGANVESVTAGLSRSRLTAEERQLLVPAQASVAADARAIELAPLHPLEGGVYYLLVAPRLRDADGHKLAGNGARFEYTVAAHAPVPRLLAPLPGAEVPLNLTRVLAHADGGAVALVDAKGAVVAGPVAASGDVALPLRSALTAGATYTLSAGAGAIPDMAIVASSCRRAAPVAVENGAARLFVRDASVDVELGLDGPAEVEVQLAPPGATCANGCIAVRAVVACAPPPCGVPSFSCPARVRVEGLTPARTYALRVTAWDLQGFESRTAQQIFETAASVPRVLISEVMAAPGGAAPRSDGEYVELFNLGPGAAQLDTLALAGEDGVSRPLLSTPPPQPVMLPSGARALVVGASFDTSRYPGMPAGTPVLRAGTQRLLGSGLRDDPVPAMRLVVPGDVPIEIASFPGGSFRCAAGTPVQRDESAPPGADALWTCGASGGTPGRPP